MKERRPKNSWRKCRNESQERKQQLEDELWKEVGDYIFSWEPGKRRSGTLNANKW